MRVFTCIFSLKGKTPTLQNIIYKIFLLAKKDPITAPPDLSICNRLTHKYTAQAGGHNLSGMTGIHPRRYIGSNPIICTNKGVTYVFFRFHNTIIC